MLGTVLTIAAIAGDATGYAIGRHTGRALQPTRLIPFQPVSTCASR
jgi:membrane protein DedA with SNARE-associated domain